MLSRVDETSVPGPVPAAERDTPMEGDGEQLDELSPSTLGSYIKKASHERGYHGAEAGRAGANRDRASEREHSYRGEKRQRGIEKALGKLTGSPVDEDAEFQGSQEDMDRMIGNTAQAPTKTQPKAPAPVVGQTAASLRNVATTAQDAAAQSNRAASGFDNISKKLDQMQAQPQQGKASSTKAAGPMYKGQATGDNVYQIKKGDTLSKIAKDAGTTVAELVKLNGIKDPNRIAAGASITLPAKAASTTTTPDQTSGTAPSAFKPGTTPGQPAIGAPATSQAQLAQAIQSTPQAQSQPGWWDKTKSYLAKKEAENAARQAAFDKQQASMYAGTPAQTPVSEAVNIGQIVKIETAPGMLSKAKVMAINESQITVATRFGTEYTVGFDDLWINLSESKKADKDYDKDGKIESSKDEVIGSRLRAAKKAGKLKEEEKADKDYDGDGKIESGKDEYMGSRMKAAKKSGKLKESEMSRDQILSDLQSYWYEIQEKEPEEVMDIPSAMEYYNTLSDRQLKQEYSRLLDSDNEVYEAKPSAGLSKEKKSAVAKKAKAGKDIGKKGKGFDALAKKAGGGEKGKKIAAAAMWKNIKREDVNEADMVGLDEKKRRPNVPKGPVVEVVNPAQMADKAKTVMNQSLDSLEDMIDDMRDAAPAVKESGYTGKGNHKPGWMKRADPALGKKLADIKKANRPPLPKPSDEWISKHEKKSVNTDLDEKAVSKKQQKFMGMVHAAQKGEKPASKKVADVAKSMKKGDVTDFAKTKHKDLPNKKKADECTSSGAVATAMPLENNEAKMGNMQFGQGVYESKNARLEKMINESMNISVNMNTDSPDGPTKSITVTATDEDADQLARLLNLAGLGSDHQEEPQAIDIEVVDENSPDWPTNPETSDDALQYSGGLNKPKVTGQTTIPVVASQKNRIGKVDESVELERTLFKLFQHYKGE